MSLIRTVLEHGTQAYTTWTGGRQPLPESPRKILVLRNNDIGDLLVVTPIFETLKRRFPQAEIIAAIGDWNRDVLLGNPWVDRVVSVNAPWHNKFSAGRRTRFRRLWLPLVYLASSREIAALQAEKIDIGIDVTGTWEGAAFMARAGIRSMISVNGYGGGHLSASATIPFNGTLHVAQAAMNQAALLGATEFPERRPQLFLSEDELSRARAVWSAAFGEGTRRLFVFPTAGYANKARTASFFRELNALLNAQGDAVALGGGAADIALGDELARGYSRVQNWCGKHTLRETFALIAASDAVICHSSMPLHAAAAFRKPTVVLLTGIYNVEEHQEAWGYSGPCVMVGPEPGLTDHQEAGRAVDVLRTITESS